MQLSAILNQFKHLGLAIILCVLITKATAQQVNYEAEFGADYQRAVRFLEKNSWITDTLARYNVPAQFAVAIVFPELIRYSVLRDKMEIGGLKILYTSFGQDYADFSIGNFQMKPSFAEHLIKDLQTTKMATRFNRIIIDSNEESGRKALVNNLESLQSQVMYLIAFYFMCEKKHSKLIWHSTEDKLQFYATAYNCGYWNTTDYIQKKSRQNYFETSIFGDAPKYNYSAIALHFFRKYNLLAKSSN
ncbi:hypothetical protein [Solitalea canadensis]|nr:hypothetical protein [Solitalea canadensis]